MAKQKVSSAQLSRPSGHFSQGISVDVRGRLVFLSGMTARDLDGTVIGKGDIEAQTQKVCENLQAAMAAAGGSMTDIVSVTVFVRNTEHFAAIHRIRRQFFADPPPASTLVEVSKLVDPEMLIEINAIAAIEDGAQV
ncbi:RidA family protein [Embleya sp. NPDC127516]|uniref:RidA family protein n=1 Tax=Embleya sp. NPDC127516 TaxID=3363990 RepID=UPI00382607C5